MAIYVKFERQRTVKEFLELLYSCFNSSFLTCVETYYDKECKNVQCQKGKYRSIDEVMEIVNTYYPSFTLKKLAKLLHSMEIIKSGTNIKYTFYSLYCSKVNKTTTLFVPYRNSGGGKNKGTSTYSPDEFYKLSKT